MDPEIKVTSATEAPEIELASAADDLEIESMSDTEDPMIDVPLFFTTKSSACIFRATAGIRYGRESDFEPKLVSIGPYYHGRENLKRMEDFKVRCMSDLLKKRPVGGSNIDRVPVNPFMEFESNARRFYKEEFKFSDVEFVEMLVLDSCFVIRIMLALSKDLPFLDLNIKEAASDLLLLENQIPLFFINAVCYWFDPNAGYGNTLFELLLNTFMQLDLPWWIKFRRTLPVNSDHLLHLYWKISEESIKEKIIKEAYASPQELRRLAKKKKEFEEKRKKEFEEEMLLGLIKIRRPVEKLIANAIELHHMAGINFENVKMNRYNNGVCVEFSKGIMRMPCLKIESIIHTTLLVNLIAFENSMLPSIRTISTYIKIMDDLIDSDKDVELLQKSGIAYNTLYSHARAATFFNDIGNICLIDYNENPFSGLFENVNKYYKSSCNRSWAS